MAVDVATERMMIAYNALWMIRDLDPAGEPNQLILARRFLREELLGSREERAPKSAAVLELVR